MEQPGIVGADPCTLTTTVPHVEAVPFHLQGY